MNTFPKVGIITVNWRNSKDTIDCVESLLRQDYPNYQIIVIDNGSDDGSIERIAPWLEEKLGGDFASIWAHEAEAQSLTQKVILLKSKKNLGFAGGNNLASRVAARGGAKCFWFINNDTIHEKGALSALVYALQTADQAGMICSKVLYFDRPDVIESLGAVLLHPLGIFRHRGQGEKDYPAGPQPVEVPYIYGCSFLVNTELVEDIGIMDERYFILIEESDWSIRARDKGWRLYCAPVSKVWHKVSATIVKRSEIFFYYVTRNTLLFMKTHYPVFLPLVFPSLFFLTSGLILAEGFFPERKLVLKRYKMVILGYCHFLQGRFGKIPLP